MKNILCLITVSVAFFTPYFSSGSVGGCFANRAVAESAALPNACQTRMAYPGTDGMADFYSTLHQVDLPLDYRSFESMTGKLEFKRVPPALDSVLNGEHDNHCRAIKLPARNGVRPLLISAEDERGEWVLNLYLLSEKFEVIGMLPIYRAGDTEVDGRIGSSVVLFRITKQYEIILRTVFVPFAESEEKLLREEKYTIDGEGIVEKK